MTLASPSGPQAFSITCYFGCDPPFIRMSDSRSKKERNQHVMPFLCHLVVSMEMHMGKTLFRRLLKMFTYKYLLVHWCNLSYQEQFSELLYPFKLMRVFTPTLFKVMFMFCLDRLSVGDTEESVIHLRYLYVAFILLLQKL